MSQPPPFPPESLAESIPDAIPMAYALPETGDAPREVRPGVLTAIGVMSIVVSVLQFGAALTLGFMAFGVYILSIVPPPQPYHPTVATTNFPDGLPIERAAMLSNRITELYNLPRARHDSLDALLRQSGKDIAPTMLNGSIAPASVKKFVTSHAKNSEGHDLLLTSTGRIELSDTDASFEPSGSTDVISVETAKMGLNVIVPNQPTTPVAAPPKVNISGLALINWFFTTAATGLLSILLLIAGILALRDNRATRRTHLWWAGLKLPIAILGAIGTGVMIAVFAQVGSQQNVATGQPPPPPGTDVVAGIVTGAVQGCLSVAYIIAVIVVMNLRSVRAWLNTR